MADREVRILFGSGHLSVRVPETAEVLTGPVIPALANPEAVVRGVARVLPRARERRRPPAVHDVDQRAADGCQLPRDRAEIRAAGERGDRHVDRRGCGDVERDRHDRR